MNTFRLYLCVCLCFLCDSAAHLASALPPAVTYLFPAGARRGTTAEVTAAGTFDKWPVKFWASGKGVTVEPAKGKGKLSIKVDASAAPGVYWLRAYNDDGASLPRPFIVGTLPEVMEKEPNNEGTSPQVLDGPPLVVNGQLSRGGDVDCFAVTLKKGQTLVAALEANRTLKSPMDGVLQVLSADGFVLAQNNDFHGLDPQLAFQAPKDGTYIARVFAFPAMPDSSIRFSGAETYVYRLTLTAAAFADHALPLAVSRTEGPKQVALEGWNLPLESSRVTLKTPPSDETHLSLSEPWLANPVLVRIEPHATYNLLSSTPAAPDRFAAPFSATGRISEPGSEVKVPIVARKGQALSIQVESQAFGLSVNPVVRVLDATGKQAARGEPGKLHNDTTLAFTPTADGTYTVVVADLYAGGGKRFAFLLRVLAREPDYELSVAADRFAVPPEKPLDIPVKVNRLNGFSRPVEVVAEGLPEGLKLEVKPPAGKADPNTVTVTLTAEKPGVSGPFRLVGRVKGQAGQARVARAPLPDFDETIADLWATVSDTPVSQPPKKKKK